MLIPDMSWRKRIALAVFYFALHSAIAYFSGRATLLGEHDQALANDHDEREQTLEERMARSVLRYQRRKKRTPRRQGRRAREATADEVAMEDQKRSDERPPI